eukprot:5098212-Prymnesium_polylepis.1
MLIWSLDWVLVALEMLHQAASAEQIRSPRHAEASLQQPTPQQHRNDEFRAWCEVVRAACTGRP